MIKYSNKGFTLIEVMIASIIIFLAISLATLSYKHSIDTNLKIIRIYQIVAELPNVRNQIKEKLRVNPELNSGTIELTNNIRTEWKVIDSQSTNTKPWLDPEAQVSNIGGYTLHLKKIEVVFSRYNESMELLRLRTIEIKLLEWERT